MCFFCLSVPLAMESLGFLDALNSAPVPGIKIKKKKPKAASPTSNKVGWKSESFFSFLYSFFLRNKQIQSRIHVFPFLSIFHSHVRLKASPSHTPQARSPSLLPPRLLRLTLLLTSLKTWNSQGHLSPLRTLRLWTLVSFLTHPCITVGC